jgi:hypothetical protein
MQRKPVWGMLGTSNQSNEVCLFRDEYAGFHEDVNEDF